MKPNAPYDPDSYLIATKPRGSADVDRPPDKDDTEYIPAATRRVMELQEEMKARRNKKRQNIEDQDEAQQNPLKKRQHESDKKHMKRLQREANIAIAKSQFEAKFQVEVDGIANGEVRYKKVKKKTSGNKRWEQFKEKKQKKQKQAQSERELGFEKFADKVEFGEVAMAPPSLSAKPRKADQKGTRPGVKSLLLKEIMETNQRQNPMAFVRESVGKTTKKNQLSLAKQKMLNEEREKAINQYRQLKKQKMKS